MPAGSQIIEEPPIIPTKFNPTASRTSPSEFGLESMFERTKYVSTVIPLISSVIYNLDPVVNANRPLLMMMLRPLHPLWIPLTNHT